MHVLILNCNRVHGASLPTHSTHGRGLMPRQGPQVQSRALAHPILPPNALLPHRACMHSTRPSTARRALLTSTGHGLLSPHCTHASKCFLPPLSLQYLVKRRGLDITEYGVVDARAAKRQRLGGDDAEAAACPLPLELVCAPHHVVPVAEGFGIGGVCASSR